MSNPNSELSEDAKQIIKHLNATTVELHERRSKQIFEVFQACRAELQTISKTLGEILELLKKRQY